MPQETSRRQQLQKKKRANLLINSLLGIVGLLIIITLVNLLSSNDQETASDTEAEQTEQQQPAEDEGQQEVESEDLAGADAAEDQAEETEAEDSEASDTEASEDADKEQTAEITTQPSDDPKVKETIVNSAWQPIGTSQTGNHVSSYEKGTTDWNEKLQALQYATGLSPDNMITIFLGNGGSPQKAIGTVTSNDQSEKYRVYLEWVDGEGWKPTKMDVLNELP
ncbi:hypothetical protein CQS04_01180 [Chryseomicrobium excrementi]|uniref:DUF1510 domain-containing protein n=1 Tax=Chryseomicrobium excrementi TaxID=2041346 RepID=A0A2M9F236_9BACL|nr:YrrS family protein [Chryseomicrobium excrementi]PJK17523.1 hypothetical protein CQS04_01180 [Chryseomicrobium excrementi]